MATNLTLENSQYFFCSLCDYKTSRNSHYQQHINTNKHKKYYLATEKGQNSQINFKCEICEKIYKDRTGLWKHKKVCNSKKNKENKIDKKLGNNQINTIVNLFHEQLKENKELKELLIEQNKKIIELASNNNNITNNITNNNTKFNMNFFLNEKCKDALNLVDFINSIQLKITDFENFGTFGYADNISRILLREIKDVDIYKRPIHCSDLKREIIHVKDENAWKKDEDNIHMKKAIKEIAYKNFKKIIPEWVKENPDSKDITTKKHDQYIKMMSNSMGELTEEGDEKNYNKIIRTVAKEILVEKDK